MTELAQGYATFSPCRRWRYSLTREFATFFGDGTVTIIGLNPSTADEIQDDPTIRRCLRFARDWGYSRLKMVNLYAWRSTDPKGLWAADNPVGPDNDHALSLAFGGSDLIVAAWGTHARPDRLTQFADTFGGWQFHALGVNKDGSPKHPLYLPARTTPTLYDLGASLAPPRVETDAHPPTCQCGGSGKVERGVSATYSYPCYPWDCRVPECKCKEGTAYEGK